jgi:hypothetical protein
MKFIIALEVEAENLHEADHIAEAIASEGEVTIAFVQDADTFNHDMEAVN